MRVLSLFDGISVARLALHNLGITPDTYLASEIDRHAMNVSSNRWDDVIQLGDVTKLSLSTPIDLLIFGSPCTDLSSMKKVTSKTPKGLMGERSGLFFDAVRLIETVRPKYWLMENVASMRNADRDRISEILGAKPVMIDSRLLTAQQRRRYYWANFPIEVPQAKEVAFSDVLEPLNAIPQCYAIHPRLCQFMEYQFPCGKTRWDRGWHNDTDRAKSQCVTAGQNTGVLKVCIDRRAGLPIYRRLTPVECERLQGLPDGYTEGISDAQRYKAIGNSFTCPVIEWILGQVL